MTDRELHRIVAAAASGELPEWANVRPRRLKHMASVAELLTRWAAELGLDDRDRKRWTAAGWLHDVLRDTDPAALEAEAGDFPRRIRHGPAAAARLRSLGVGDEELLEAIAYHSLGKRGLRRLGRFLYLADYLEPKRPYAPVEHAAIRARLPEDEANALRWVCVRRIVDRLSGGKPLRLETVEFWDELVRGG